MNGFVRQFLVLQVTLIAISLFLYPYYVSYLFHVYIVAIHIQYKLVIKNNNHHSNQRQHNRRRKPIIKVLYKRELGTANGT